MLETLFFKPVHETKELPTLNRDYLQNNFKKLISNTECDYKKLHQLKLNFYQICVS